MKTIEQIAREAYVEWDGGDAADLGRSILAEWKKQQEPVAGIDQHGRIMTTLYLGRDNCIPLYTLNTEKENA